MKDDNIIILARMRGMRANPATPESDADPQNPNMKAISEEKMKTDTKRALSVLVGILGILIGIALIPPFLWVFFKWMDFWFK